ncbi:ketopantoate reductase family protein [Brevundimonas nasdae]|uniref:ketopantoate reductase family protein n=1 Tax=Brevundimonas nasdae TaxID=172043 RepID=UPI003F694B21
MSHAPDQQPKILIVGAGAMGVVTGYHLDLAGAAVTFLVRPHRLPALQRPQVLYSYDDGGLKTFSAYGCITTADALAYGCFDYMLLTLDGVALRNPEGVSLIKAIGAAALDTPTKVIIGAIGIGLKPWFMRLSGLAEDQVFNGAMSIMAYPPASVLLPLHPPTNAAHLAQADLAYVHSGEKGFIVEDSAAEAAHRFSEIYNRCGVSTCEVRPAAAFATSIPALFPVFAASDLMGWPQAEELGADPELWALTTEAVREIQDLGGHGQGVTTGQSLIEMWKTWQAATLPMDLQAFNRFHHGGKVNAQDQQLLLDCVAAGQAIGQPMKALQMLVERITAHRLKSEHSR